MGVNAKPESDSYVKVSGIVRADNGEPLDSITSVAASFRQAVKDANGRLQPGDEVSGSAVSLTVVTSEPDAYEGTIPYTVTLVSGTQYFLKIVTIGVVNSVARRLTEYHLFTADNAIPRQFFITR
jgi:hypothetical protein